MTFVLGPSKIHFSRLVAALDCSEISFKLERLSLAKLSAELGRALFSAAYHKNFAHSLHNYKMIQGNPYKCI